MTFKLRSAGEKQPASKDWLFREDSESKGQEVGKLKLLAGRKKQPGSQEGPGVKRASVRDAVGGGAGRRQVMGGPFPSWQSTVASFGFIPGTHLEHQLHRSVTQQCDLASWSLCFFTYDMEIILINYCLIGQG